MKYIKYGLIALSVAAAIYVLTGRVWAVASCDTVQSGTTAQAGPLNTCHDNITNAFNAHDHSGDEGEEDDLAPATVTTSGACSAGGNLTVTGNLDLDGAEAGPTDTPTANVVYPNLVIKGWADVQSDGTLDDGVNLSVSASGGDYTYTFKTAMEDANYAVQVTSEGTMGVGTLSSGSGIFWHCVADSLTTSGFHINCYKLYDDGGGAYTDLRVSESARAHVVIVVGEQ